MAISKHERVRLLEKTAVFSHLSKKDCQMLAPVFKERALVDEEALCRQGDPGDYLAVVAQGTVVVEVIGADGDTTVVSRRDVGDAVGEMACLDPAPRSATVRSKGPAEVLVLTRTMLDSLKHNAPKLFSRVVRGLAERLAQMLDETNDLIADLLTIKREPTQPRQPSLAALQDSSSSAEPMGTEVDLCAEGALEGLSDEERAVLRTATEARRYSAGAVVCVEGEPAPEAYFVTDGEVDVLRNVEGKNYRLATVSSGGFLGQRALLREGRRSASLRVGPQGATLMHLSRQQFDALLEAESTLAIGFQEAVTITGIRQLRQANEMAAYLGTRDQKKFGRPQSQRIERQPKPDESLSDRLEHIADLEEVDVEEEDDIASLASAYLATSLEDWDLTPSELDKIEVESSEGQMSAAEKKLRDKLGD